MNFGIGNESSRGWKGEQSKEREGNHFAER